MSAGVIPDVAKAVRLLDECLNDEVAWDGEELVERMEDVREALTGERVPPDPPVESQDAP